MEESKDKGVKNAKKGRHRKRQKDTWEKNRTLTRDTKEVDTCCGQGGQEKT